MSNVHTLADVKRQYGEKVIETARSFIINAYGKYLPGLSFVLDKDFSGDPLEYRKDAPTKELVANTGISFGTSESGVSVLFGDFWLSRSGKPHFRPKSYKLATHVIIRADWGGFSYPGTRGRWSAPDGVAYFRRASSNGGGTGYDYYVVPVGYRLIHDEELGGDAVGVKDSERAEEIRRSYREYDEMIAARKRAEAKAKADAEAASRRAKKSFMPRLEALERRLSVLERTDKIIIHDSGFSFGSDRDLLFTEENLRMAERSVQLLEHQAEERKAREAYMPLFDELKPRAEALGTTLEHSYERVYLSGDTFSGGYRYSKEGIASMISALDRLEAEAIVREEETKAKEAKAKAEAEASKLGLPSNVRIWRRNGITDQGDGWVIRPDGTFRDADEMAGDSHRIETYREGTMIWHQILPGELVLKVWSRDRYDIIHCEVIYRPDSITQAQADAAKRIEEQLEAPENAFGLDDRLARLLERRRKSIQEAMTELPEDLQPSFDWGLDWLASDNGIGLDNESAERWVDETQPFTDCCHGREAQVVYRLPAADGVLEALVYQKWGGWNANLRWREQTTSSEETDSPATPPADEETTQEESPVDMTEALKMLQERFNC
jgi:hypothetical protein